MAYDLTQQLPGQRLGLLRDVLLVGFLHQALFQPAQVRVDLLPQSLVIF